MIIELFKRVPLLCISSWINHRLLFSPSAPFEIAKECLYSIILLHPHPTSSTRSIIYSNLYIFRVHIRSNSSFGNNLPGMGSAFQSFFFYPAHQRVLLDWSSSKWVCKLNCRHTHMQLLRLHLLLCPCCGTYRGLCFVVACSSSSAVIQECWNIAISGWNTMQCIIMCERKVPQGPLIGHSKKGKCILMPYNQFRVPTERNRILVLSIQDIVTPSFSVNPEQKTICLLHNKELHFMANLFSSL